MSTPEGDPPDLASLLYARMPDAPDELTMNGAPVDVAIAVTASRAEQPAVDSYPVDIGPPLGERAPGIRDPG